MKKLIILSFLLILCSFTDLNGQIAKYQTKSPWSLSLSYAPKFEIRRPLSPFSRAFVKSINIMTDKMILDHFSISFGLDYFQKTENETSLHFDGSIPISHMLIRSSFTEFPIQLNYHLRDDSKRLNPYIKTSLRNVYYHQYYRRVSTQEYYSSKRNYYYLLCDFGLGSYLKVKNKLSIMFQGSIGFGLKYQTPQYTYFEGLAGIRYTLTK